MDSQPQPQSNNTSKLSRPVNDLESIINPEIHIDLTRRGRPKKRKSAGARLAEGLADIFRTDNGTI